MTKPAFPSSPHSKASHVLAVVTLAMPFALATSLWLTQALLVLGFVFWLLSGAFKTSPRFSVYLPLTLLLGSILTSWLHGSALGWDGPRMGGLWVWLMLPVFSSLRSSPQNELRTSHLFFSPQRQQAFAGLALLLAIYAILQNLTGLDLAHWKQAKILRLDGNSFAAIGFFNRHHTFGTLCALLAAWVSGWPGQENASVWPRRLALIALSLCVLASQSRAALLALLLSQGYLFWQSLPEKRGKSRLIFLGGLICALVVLAFLPRWQEMQSLEGWSNRLAIWGVSEQGLSSGFPLGLGYGRSFLSLDPLFSVLHPQSLIRSGTHMDFLGFWLESGVLGAVAYLWLLSTLWLDAKGSSLWLRAVVLVFALTGLVHNSWFDGELALCFYFLLSQGLQMPCQTKTIALEN